jgi:hypothetical protein
MGEGCNIGVDCTQGVVEVRVRILFESGDLGWQPYYLGSDL